MSWSDINAEFKGSQSSPQPQFDNVTKELINYNMDFGYHSSTYNFFSVSPSEPTGHLIASVSAKASVVHSFALTPHYIILVCHIYSVAGIVEYAYLNYGVNTGCIPISPTR
jgi:carotenoid cleavage dioxygenase-like enzyme